MCQTMRRNLKSNATDVGTALYVTLRVTAAEPRSGCTLLNVRFDAWLGRILHRKSDMCVRCRAESAHRSNILLAGRLASVRRPSILRRISITFLDTSYLSIKASVTA